MYGDESLHGVTEQEVGVQSQWGKREVNGVGLKIRTGTSCVREQTVKEREGGPDILLRSNGTDNKTNEDGQKHYQISAKTYLYFLYNFIFIIWFV